MLEMPNEPNAANHTPAPDPDNLCKTAHKAKISPIKVIDIAAPRAALDKIEKRIRLYASRIDQLAAELRDLVDNLGAGIVTATPPASATVTHIIDCVAEHTGVGANAIRSIRQDRTTVRARHTAFYLASELTSLSLPKLGSFFGRDHTTILHGINNVRRRLQTSAALRDDIEAITATIEGRA